jgi:hypothetical protein
LCASGTLARAVRLSRSVGAAGSAGSCSTIATVKPSRRRISPSSSAARPAITREQRRLPGAVAPDEPDALAPFQAEVGIVEQRQVAIGELAPQQCQQRHVNCAMARPRAAALPSEKTKDSPKR